MTKSNIRSLMKQNIKFIILFVFSVCVILFTYNNSFLYSDTIVKILNTQTINTDCKPDFYGNDENVYTQLITAKVMNGTKKGQTVEFTNVYSYSQAINTEYQKGDFLFVTEKSPNKISVTCQKRDFLLVAGIIIFIFILLIIGRKKGTFTLMALILNISVTLCVVFLYSKGVGLIIPFTVAALIFIISTTLLLNGNNNKTYVSIISTISGLIISCLITFLTIKITGSKGIYFEQIDFVIKDAYELFFIQIIVGNLGGIMDICVSMSSAIHEIIRSNPDASFLEIKKSAHNISSDIMGTMTSTILFAYIAGDMPMFLILVKNDYSLSYIYENCLNIELIRALTGCIGMVLSIPISILVSMKFFRKEIKK